MADLDLSTREGRREQGKLIQRAAEEAGFSIEELANRIGCSRALLYQYLSGATLAQPDRLQQIAAATGMPLSQFFGAALSEEARPARRAAGETSADRLRARLAEQEQLCAAYESPPDWRSAAQAAERLVYLCEEAGDREGMARSLIRLGRARIRLGEFAEAVANLERAVSLAEDQGSASASSSARQALGNALLALGRLPEAKRQFERVAKSEGWRERWLGEVSLAAVCEQEADYRAAMEHCSAAAAILDAGTNPDEVEAGLVYVDANRLNILLACGDLASAGALASACLARSEAQGNGDQNLEARLSLASLALLRGRFAEARATASSAHDLARFLGDKSRAGIALSLLAMAEGRCGLGPEAVLKSKTALANALSAGDRRGEVFAQLAQAENYRAAKRLSEARYHAGQALAAATSARLTLYQAEALLRISEIAIDQDDGADADEHISRAARLTEQKGMRHLFALALALQAERALAAGDPGAALEAAARSAEIAQSLGLAPAEWRARAVLARANDARGEPKAALKLSNQAVELVRSVRQSLIEAGLADTLLEHPEHREIYRLHVALLERAGLEREASRFLKQAEWPPLLSERTRRKPGDV